MHSLHQDHTSKTKLLGLPVKEGSNEWTHFGNPALSNGKAKHEGEPLFTQRVVTKTTRRLAVSTQNSFLFNAM